MCRMTDNNNWEEFSFVLRHLVFTVDEVESLKYLDYEWMNEQKRVMEDNCESNVINGDKD